MKVMGFEIERLHLFLGYLDSAFVRSAIQARLDEQSRLCRGPSDEIDNRAVVGQRSASPICTDEGE